MTIRNTTILIFVLASLILNVQTSDASWLIDPEKFHTSVHGQASCQDCHENITEQDLHPNPANVNKNLQDFFSVDSCLSCHDNVMDDLNENVYGTTRDIEDPQKYENCLKCHDPHYQLGLGEDQGRFDPAKPRREQCGACHETRTSLPPPSDEDRACLACHRAIDPKDSQMKDQISRLCFHCHSLGGTQAQEMTGKRVSLINSSEYRSVPHAGLACTACHLDADQFKHTNQKRKDCRQCHLHHDEKVAHDSHMGVACEACHLAGVKAARDPESKRVFWDRKRKPGEPSSIHEMIIEDDETSCQRCHFKGNQVGAASMILPAKSIMCMPCHTATFSVDDTTTILALIVFLVGIVMIFSYWLSGATPGERYSSPVGRLFNLLWNGIKTVFSRKIFLIIKAMILDVLLQRRLFRQSGVRWLIHSLIFLPFVFRFFWGLIALITSLWAPECTVTWPMLDKNHPVTAFLFDMTGIMVILGAALAFIRGLLKRSHKPPGLPGQDRLALSLIGGIVAIGFILEGMRIAMTGSPAGACYAFIGCAVSTLFSDSTGLTQSYGYIWYIHAILTGIFVAYLPFSRMFHIIMGPIVLAMNAISEHETGRR